MRCDDRELLRRVVERAAAAAMAEGGEPEGLAAPPRCDDAAGGVAAGTEGRPMPTGETGEGTLRRTDAGLRGAGGGRGTAADAEAERLAALWSALEPPAAAPAPPGFAGRVMARVREEHTRRRRPLGRFGRLPARWAAAAALSAGLVAGAGLGAWLGSGEVAEPAGTPSAARASASADATGAADADALLAAAVAAAAAGEDAAAPAAEPEALFAAEPELAGEYLAALAALEEAS